MHYYQYLHDPDFVIESEEPRPDLLEWAYWSEIDAPVKSKPAPKPEPESEPVAKPARRPRAKAGESE
ncbi:hypothetical protein [Nocardia asiatica]|uniref:hypothetical protein n=1 Tax=Nocardia asiatica TaxID=209252 RepID=UPI002458B667|nr:hypothetical protein [Nocardia asiatica]